MNFTQLPKIELHCHLDGSVRPQTVLALALQQGMALPTEDSSEIQALMVAPPSCPSLIEYLQRFELPISVMQTAEALSRVAFEVLEDAAAEQVRYIEVRFAPSFHLQQGLGMEQAIAAVLDGMDKAKAQFAIDANLILCGMRGFPIELCHQTLKAGQAFLGKGVVAFDLAGREDPGFSKDYVEVCQKAKAMGYRLTIHAGETGCAQNVVDAIELLGAERIGHGVYVCQDAQALALVKARKVALEVCPTSNIQTKAFAEMARHPVAEFVRDGVAVNISTDNRTVSDTTVTTELDRVDQAFVLTIEEYRRIYRASVAACFATSEIKEGLLALNDHWW
ncbi:adenosine deaminase [Ferrimonas pelagia]|uniref:Adenosine deaminase n=1 Tax=Ferrimonas pelagia TaxID=1177826 RepID=A0ABP9FBJ2_9GAMM